MLYWELMKKLPSSWDTMRVEERFRVVGLDINSPEEQEVKSRFKGVPLHHQDFKIHRVQNPLMFTKFLLKRDDYKKKGEVEVRTLYHDTAASNVLSICEFNLDWRRGDRCKYGPGVYFSAQPRLANKHSTKTHDRERAMFIVDVLVQNIQKTDAHGFFLPDPGYDTVLAHNDQTYVKYFDNEFYPRYFVVYDAYGFCPPTYPNDYYAPVNNYYDFTSDMYSS